MTVLGIPILTLVVFAPLAGVLLLMLVGRDSDELAKWVTLVTSGATFLLSLDGLNHADKGNRRGAGGKHSARLR